MFQSHTLTLDVEDDVAVSQVDLARARERLFIVENLKL